MSNGDKPVTPVKPVTPDPFEEGAAAAASGVSPTPPPPGGEEWKIEKREGYVVFLIWNGAYYEIASGGILREGDKPVTYTAPNGQVYLLDPTTATAKPFAGLPGTAPEPTWVGGKPYSWNPQTGKYELAPGLPEQPQKRNVQLIQHGDLLLEYNEDTGELKHIDLPALKKQRRTDVMNTPQGWQLVDLDTGEIIKDYPYKEKPDKLTAWEQRSIDLQTKQLALDWERQAKQDQLSWAQFAASLSGPKEWAKYSKLVGGVEPTPPDWMAQYTGRAPEYETTQEAGWGAFGGTAQPWGAAQSGMQAGVGRISPTTGAAEQWWAGEPSQQLRAAGMPEQTPQAGTWARMTPTQQQQILGWQEYGGESSADYLARMSKKWPSWGAPQPTRTAIPSRR